MENTPSVATYQVNVKGEANNKNILDTDNIDYIDITDRLNNRYTSINIWDYHSEIELNCYRVR